MSAGSPTDTMPKLSSSDFVRLRGSVREWTEIGEKPSPVSNGRGDADDAMLLRRGVANQALSIDGRRADPDA